MIRLFGSVAIMSLVACVDRAPLTGPTLSASALRNSRGLKVDTARANLVWADSVNTAAAGGAPVWSPSGIRGDSRDKFGHPASFSEYQGNFCGVSAVLGVDGGSSLNADPDFGYTASMATACGTPARVYRFYYDGATTPTYSAGPHHTVMNLSPLTVGQSFSEEVWFGVQQTGCQRLSFSSAYAPSNNALITRLPDVAGSNGMVRQWLVSSQGSHRAMCLVPTKNGTLVSSGVSHFLPFSLTITEVLPPAPVYP